jgi:hypothetical protein
LLFPPAAPLAWGARLFGSARTGNTGARVVQSEAASDKTALATAARLLATAGQQLTVVPQVDFVKRPLSRGRAALVPTSLPRLPLRQAVATITLPRT